MSESGFELDGAGVAVADPELAERRQEIPLPAWYRAPENRFRSPQTIYFDLETVGDDARAECFGLPEIVGPPPRATLEQCPPVEAVLAKSIEVVKGVLAEHRPPEGWLVAAETVELGAAKPRQGVLSALGAELAAIHREPQLHAEELADRRKLLATTPEFCRIVAVGWATAVGDAQSIIVEPDDPFGETQALKFLWRLFRHAQPVVGFNCLHFDLPVLLARSAILGVEPIRTFDLRPWGKDVLDLFAARFPKGPGASNGRPAKLKELARVYGIPVPAGDTDGGDVERLLAEDPEKLREYVESDVEITRGLHRKWMGYFC